MDNHVDSLHADQNHEEVKFVCVTCKHAFVGKDGLNQHVKTHDNLNASQGTTDLLLENTENNDATTNLDELSENVKEAYNCVKCDFSFPDPVDLNCHIASLHTNKNKYEVLIDA